MGKTRLIYLEDPTTLHASCNVVEVMEVKNGVFEIAVEATPFYAKRGGQDSEAGRIATSTGSMEINGVTLRNGTAWHCGEIVGSIEVGQVADLYVNAEERLLHSQLHTAGELLIVAMRIVGYDLKVCGAIHYPQQSSVDFVPTDLIEHNGIDAGLLEGEINSLIEVGGKVKIEEFVDPVQIQSACGFYPDYLPENEVVRVVTVAGKFGRPCTGTHVADIGMLPTVRIRKWKVKKQKLTISYCLE